MRRILKKPLDTIFLIRSLATAAGVVMLVATALAPAARGEAAAPTATDATAQTPPAPAENTLFHHGTGRFWIAGQVNEIFQEHAPFRAAYSGPNSLHAVRESALSNLWTLYTGYEITKTSEVLVDVERATGHGISDAAGLGGFTDLDVVRNPQLGSRPYLARAIFHKVIPLAGEDEGNDRNFLSVLPSEPVRRVDFCVGKFSTVDFFDLNSAGSDSHLQFLNWTVDNNGAYDYMADTRGYTLGALVEWHERTWSIRAAVGLMPVVANGLRLDKTIRRDRGMNLELESRRPVLANRRTVVRVLLYRNLARMGVYRNAIEAARFSGTAPDITLDDRPGRSKTGAGINIEQELSDAIRLFTRAGWNDGRTESFAYTEVDRTIEIGADTRIPHRPGDRLGLAFVANGLSPEHRDYLAAGGRGFVLGDGGLNYGRERILETYYTARLYRGVSVAGDLQWIRDPGFNRDRGPVLVRSLRMHVDF